MENKFIIFCLIGLILLFGCVSTAPQPSDLNSFLTDSNFDVSKNASSWYPSEATVNLSLDNNLKLTAILFKNPALCNQIVSEQIKNNCYLNVALSLKDSSICNNIDLNSEKYSCLNYVQRQR